jgi:pimeloyl-ACP methyl ester carboxylesterase
MRSVSGRAHVVGHSMGGWVASLLAYESPERLERLVLIASGGLATRTLPTMVEWRPPTEKSIRQRLDRFPTGVVDADAIVARALDLGRDPERVARFGRIMEHMTNPETRARYHMARRLPFVSAPTLVIWGRDDDVNPLELGTATHELIPNSQLRIIEGCGHAPHLQRPDEVGEIIVEFLSSEA